MQIKFFWHGVKKYFYKHITKAADAAIAAFIFTICLYICWHTTNFYNLCKKNSFLGLPTTQQQVTEAVKSFNILAYELNLPIVFVAGKFNASVTPSYIVPQHFIKGENGK